jgi:hypothetical protein
MAFFTPRPSRQEKQELPELSDPFTCRRPDGSTYVVETIGEYLAAVRGLLNGEIHAIYRDASGHE